MKIMRLSILIILLIFPSKVISIVTSDYAFYELASSEHGSDENGATNAGKEVLIIEGKSDVEKRLNEIELRKKELSQKRDRLIKDREQLYADADKKGLIKTQEEFDALKKRISELEQQIRQFNDEVKTLNEEEQRLINLLQKEQQAP